MRNNVSFAADGIFSSGTQLTSLSSSSSADKRELSSLSSYSSPEEE